MVIRLMKRLMINVQLIKPETDKIKRARLPAGRIEHGFVYMDMEAPWAREFLRECLGFPNLKYKDQVDAFSLAALVVQDLDEATLKAAEPSRPIPIQMVMSAS